MDTNNIIKILHEVPREIINDVYISNIKRVLIEEIEKHDLSSKEETPFLAILRQGIYLSNYVEFVKFVKNYKLPAYDNNDTLSKTYRGILNYGYYGGLNTIYGRFFLNQKLYSKKEYDVMFPFEGPYEDEDAAEKLRELGVNDNDNIDQYFKDMSNELTVQSCFISYVKCKIKNDGIVKLSPPISYYNGKFYENYYFIYYIPPVDLIEEYDKYIITKLLPEDEKEFNVPLYSKEFKNKYTYSYIGEQGEYTSVLKIKKKHLEKLASLYDKQVPFEVLIRNTEFLKRVYCMIARYETIYGNMSGYQGAVPSNVFRELSGIIKIDTECFASPLNNHFDNYYSAYYDTDKYFKSKGSFFHNFNPVNGGYYEFNPPFILQIIDEAVDILFKNLDTCKYPLLILVVLPHWDDAEYDSKLKNNKYTRGYNVLKNKEHKYIDGMQHRAKRVHFDANADSIWYLLANDDAYEELVSRRPRWKNDIITTFYSKSKYFIR